VPGKMEKGGRIMLSPDSNGQVISGEKANQWEEDREAKLTMAAQTLAGSGSL